MVTIVSNKIDFRTKNIIRDYARHFILFIFTYLFLAALCRVWES